MKIRTTLKLNDSYETSPVLIRLTSVIIWENQVADCLASYYGLTINTV